MSNNNVDEPVVESVIDEPSLLDEEIVVEPGEEELEDNNLDARVEEPVTDEVAKPAVNNEPPKYAYLNPNVTMTHNPRVAIVPGQVDTREPMGIVSLSGVEIAEIAGQQSFKNNSSNLSDDYVESLRNAMQLTYNDDIMTNACANAKELVQAIKYEDKVLHASVPTHRTRSGDNLSGIRAVAQIQRATKQGSFLNFPCWSSGIWLTLRAPTTFELADYYDGVSEEIVELGKKSGGAIFGNTSVYIAKYLIELVETLVHDCSIKDYANKNIQLRDILMVDDLQTLAWALSICMYPNGYPFEEPCLVDVDTCTAVHKTLLNVSKLFWVDKSRLTNWQQQFMSDKTVQRSVEEIRKYQLEATWLHSESYQYSGFKVLIKTPTIAEHIEAGYTWIEEVESSVRGVLKNISDTKLNAYVVERAGLTWMRRYSHYVKAFIYNDGAAVNKRADIDATLNAVCTVPSVVKQFNSDIDKHIANSAISMVAVPRYKCPECGKDNHADELVHPHLVPIDALQLFFVLRDQKLQLA